jgi:hypothetical protein
MHSLEQRSLSVSFCFARLFAFGLASLRAQSAAPGLPRAALPFAGAENRTLKLDGEDSCVELPPNIFNDLTEITVEAWVKWDKFQHYSRFFEFGSKGLAFLLAQYDVSPRLKYYIWLDPSGYVSVDAPNALKEGEWRHLAAVADQKGFRLYVDGVIAAESSWIAPLYADGGKSIGENKRAIR